MADDRDVLDKADALLRRHSPPRPGSGEAADVPVLTELITPGAAAVPPPAPADTPADPTAGTHDDAFRRELVAEIVDAVHARLVHDLERRLVQQALADVRASVAAALSEMHPDITAAVDNAVAEALARRQNR